MISDYTSSSVQGPRQDTKLFPQRSTSVLDGHGRLGRQNKKSHDGRGRHSEIRIASAGHL